jgi:hypothetical protein
MFNQYEYKQCIYDIFDYISSISSTFSGLFAIIPYSTRTKIFGHPCLLRYCFVPIMVTDAYIRCKPIKRNVGQWLEVAESRLAVLILRVLLLNI